MTKAAWGLRGVAIGALVVTGLLLALPEWWCPIARSTGVPCPGCGMTRALLALLHGDFAAAFAHHPLSLVVVPVGTWALARWHRSTPTPNQARSIEAPLAVFVTAAWLVWLLRLLLTR